MTHMSTCSAEPCMNCNLSGRSVLSAATRSWSRFIRLRRARHVWLAGVPPQAKSAEPTPTGRPTGASGREAGPEAPCIPSRRET